MPTQTPPIRAQVALSDSLLSIKGLCDYVINLQIGCRFGCVGCMVADQPMVRARKSALQERGVINPQRDWGQYAIAREGVIERLEYDLKRLERANKWNHTAAGKGVVMLSIGHDPFDSLETERLTVQAVELLLQYDRRIRILTRSDAFVKHLPLFAHPNITIGCSIPFLDDFRATSLEPKSPRPSRRLNALRRARDAGVRIYVAMAFTPPPPWWPYPQLKATLQQLAELDPEVIFWEMYNPDPGSLERLRQNNVPWHSAVADRDQWAALWMQQWTEVGQAACEIGCDHLIHIWPDKRLIGVANQANLDYWWHQPTRERWPD